MNELIYVSYVNHGTIPMDGNVEVTLNPDVTYVSAGGVGSTASYTAPIVNFVFTGLLPLETRSAVITVNVPATLALGTVLKYSAIIHPVPGDTLPTDNYDSVGVVVVGSCDPNDKLVYPTGTIMPEQKLEYTIRFQNTGTWWAENVVIRDTLDSDLDVSTFTPNGTSHACNWAVSGNIVDWTFMGIHLPDSNLDEPNSHGYVSFTIRPKPGVVNGTLITNDAGIYFDFNPVVMTNTTSNSVSIVGVDDPQNTFGLEVFPNPFSTGAVVRFQNPQHVAHQVLLTDLTGRVLMHWDEVTGQEVSIEGGSLAAGSYLVSCTRPDGTRSVAKVLVQ
jgi:uncharacterized repeat protein (TIGR01451 family)